MLWTATNHEASYSSPVGATIGGKRAACSSRAKASSALDPATGAVLFRAAWRSRIAVVGQRGDAARHRRPDFRVGELRDRRDGACACKGSALTPLWASDEVLSNHYATSVYDNGILYGFHGRQEYGPSLRAVDFKTGKVLWSVDRFKAGTDHARRRQARSSSVKAAS